MARQPRCPIPSDLVPDDAACESAASGSQPGFYRSGGVNSCTDCSIAALLAHGAAGNHAREHCDLSAGYCPVVLELDVEVLPVDAGFGLPNMV